MSKPLNTISKAIRFALANGQITAEEALSAMEAVVSTPKVQTVYVTESCGGGCGSSAPIHGGGCGGGGCGGR